MVRHFHFIWLFSGGPLDDRIETPKCGDLARCGGDRRSCDLVLRSAKEIRTTVGYPGSGPSAS